MMGLGAGCGGGVGGSPTADGGSGGKVTSPTGGGGSGSGGAKGGGSGGATGNGGAAVDAASVPDGGGADVNLSACDKVVATVDRHCTAAADCMAVQHQTDFMGQIRLLGIRSSEMMHFTDLEKT